MKAERQVKCKNVHYKLAVRVAKVNGNRVFPCARFLRA